MKIANYNINNNLILAPMAGVSDYPFRTICRDYGCELAFSEMISSEGLVRKSEKTFNYLYKADEGGNGKLIAFQIFGSKPDVMAAAAEIVVEKGADIVDINMGCPVKKVIKANAGSALLSNIPLLKNIVTAVRKRISKALTVKIRSGWQNEINVLEVSRVLEDCGVDAIILHPRTQKQGFSGYANWELIKKVKEIVKIPVIGNGDVLTYSDYKKMLNETSCDGVMIARGA
ncbi:MAG: tRNA-dihydrouridine synthase family protein, partial [Spirochaetota bacterium]|nr:tRNA-dihydrouridine synthase family protein [Spirochaetota bacterium]